MIRNTGVLAMICFGLVGCNSAGNLIQVGSTLDANSPKSNAGRNATLPFSYRTASRQLNSISSFESVGVGGQVEHCKPGEIFLNLSKGTDVKRLLKDYDLTLVKQCKIPSAPLATVGNTPMPADITFTPTDMYVLKANNLESEDLQDLSSLAQWRKLQGEHTFSSKAMAGLFHRVLKLSKFGLKDGEGASLNSIAEDQTNTTEGSNCSWNCAYTGSPSGWFWFAAGPQTLYPNFTSSAGANYNWATGGSTEDVWHKSTGYGVPVAVIDSGFISNNTSTDNGGFNASWAGAWGTYYSYDFVWNTGNIMNANDGTTPWHGRGVSSLIFSVQNDSKGTVGVATQAVPYFLNTKSKDEMATAISTCTSWGVKIINISRIIVDTTNPYGTDLTMYPAVQNFIGANGKLIAAAGNSGYATNVYPANYSGVINVGAIESGGNVSYIGGVISNTANVSIYAPGGGGDSAHPNRSGGGYDIPIGGYPYDWQETWQPAQGTSLSAPIVTGVVAALAQLGRANSTSAALTQLVSHSRTCPAGQCLDAYSTLQ